MLNDLQELEKGDFISFKRISRPRTQKAKGVFYIQDKSNDVNHRLSMNVPKHMLFKSGTLFDEKSFNYPVFGRPCPTVPRHGFVDSIVCKDHSALNTLSLTAKNAEPDSEILVTKPVDCAFNLICTNSILTIGEGNDGATGGTGCSYFYLNSDPFSNAISISENPHLLLDGEIPFYELVIDKKYKSHLVQVRSAPGVPKSKNFIPKKMRVLNIVKAEGDLLEWEAKAKTFDKETTVIDHVDGSLASHYAIHAIINNIPIFTRDLPKIGDEIEPTTSSSGITDEHKKIFRKSFMNGFILTPSIMNQFKSILQNHYGTGPSANHAFMKKFLNMTLATLHNFSALYDNQDFELLGSVIGVFSRICFAVSSGEARYKRGMSDSLKITDQDLKKYLSGLDSERSSTYTKFLSNKTEDLVRDIPHIHNTFTKIKWEGCYGGKKWAACTREVINLYNSCVSGDILMAVEFFNKIIHHSHNTGLYLNKIEDSSDIWDEAAKYPEIFAVKRLYIISLFSRLITKNTKMISMIHPNVESLYEKFKVIEDSELVDIASEQEIKKAKETSDIQKSIDTGEISKQHASIILSVKESPKEAFKKYDFYVVNTCNIVVVPKTGKGTVCFDYQAPNSFAPVVSTSLPSLAKNIVLESLHITEGLHIENVKSIVKLEYSPYNIVCDKQDGSKMKYMSCQAFKSKISNSKYYKVIEPDTKST